MRHVPANDTLRTQNPPLHPRLMSRHAAKLAAHYCDGKKLRGLCVLAMQLFHLYPRLRRRTESDKSTYLSSLDNWR